MCMITSFTHSQQKRRRCHVLKEKVVCKPLVTSTRGSLKPESLRCKLNIGTRDTTGRIFPHCEPQFLFLGEKSTSGVVETNLDSRWERISAAGTDEQ